MKIITWNCNMAFRKKAPFILLENPDIIVVPECEHPDKLIFNNATIKPKEIKWFGKNPNKGLAVLSYSDFKIELLETDAQEFEYIIPLRIYNKFISLNVFIVWACNPKNTSLRYIEQVWKAIDVFDSYLKNRNTIVIGDFNSNKIWDKYYRIGNHSHVVEKLSKKNIISAYHNFFDEEQGKENLPTLFLFRHQNKPYHVDYCFASQDLILKVKKVEVGIFEDWKHLSDHMPLIIDFDL
jgi:exodeoxyribonuclease III